MPKTTSTYVAQKSNDVMRVLIVRVGSGPALRDSPRLFGVGNLICSAVRPGSANNGRLPEIL